MTLLEKETKHWLFVLSYLDYISTIICNGVLPSTENETWKIGEW